MWLNVSYFEYCLLGSYIWKQHVVVCTWSLQGLGVGLTTFSLRTLTYFAIFIASSTIMLLFVQFARHHRALIWRFLYFTSTISDFSCRFDSIVK